MGGKSGGKPLGSGIALGNPLGNGIALGNVLGKPDGNGGNGGITVFDGEAPASVFGAVPASVFGCGCG